MKPREALLQMNEMYMHLIDKYKLSGGFGNLYDNVNKALKRLEELEKRISTNELVYIVHKNAVEHGWWEEKRTLPELLCLVHSEVSEVLEEFRNNKGITESYTNEKGKPKGIPSELADIVIRVMDICGNYGIDLEKEILNKHNFNIRRPYKHGNKKI